MRLLALLTILVGGFAVAAQAFSFAPAATSFTSAGRMKLSTGARGADCAARFDGVTDGAGRGKITLARFSGGFLGACETIRALGLPWEMTAAGPGKVIIATVRVHTPYSGDCGARDVPASLAGGGEIRFGHIALSPRCAIDGGALITRPEVAIVP